jgi:putative membrane protein
MNAVPVMHEAWGAWPYLAPIWILFWLVVVVIVIKFVGRRWATGSCSARPQDGATATLAERFARGEIDESEYRSRLAALRQ